jgi:hypothetical protein
MLLDLEVTTVVAHVFRRTRSSGGEARAYPP